MMNKKSVLRTALLAKINALPTEMRRQADEGIRRRILSMPGYLQAGTIFAFVGVGWEVDTWPLIELALAAGKTVAVPRLRLLHTTADCSMQACQIRSRADLILTSPLGLWEPKAEARILDPAEIDFALIPCIACDGRGNRLGRGGGHYDRYLAGVHFFKAAVCRLTLHQPTLPAASHDIKIDAAVTEGKVYYFRAPL